MKTRYKDSSLGVIWSLLKPLTQLAVYYFAIGQVLGAQRSIPNFAIFVFTGITAWSYFSESLGRATTSIIDNASLIKKLYLPRVVFPFAAVGAATFTFIVQFAVLLLAVLCFAPFQITADIFILPISILNIAVYSSALGLFLSAVTVYLRDTEHLIEVFLMLFFWFSPIVYSYQFVAQALGSTVLTQIYLSNPITLSVLGMQKALWEPGAANIGGGVTNFFPDNLPVLLVSSILIGLIFMAVAHRVFHRIQGNFAQQL